jgi:hypothetical protein
MRLGAAGLAVIGGHIIRTTHSKQRPEPASAVEEIRSFWMVAASAVEEIRSFWVVAASAVEEIRSFWVVAASAAEEISSFGVMVSAAVGIPYIG